MRENRCEGIWHFQQVRKIKGLDVGLKEVFERVQGFYLGLNKSIEDFVSKIDTTEFFNYFYKWLKVRYLNYRIGFLELEDFYNAFEKCLFDNYLQVLLSFLVLKKLDFETLINDSMNLQETDMRHKDSEGNYQNASFESDPYQTSESVEKSKMVTGNVLNILKGLLNKPLLLNISVIVKKFEYLFFISYEIGGNDYVCKECWD